MWIGWASTCHSVRLDCTLVTGGTRRGSCFQSTEPQLLQSNTHLRHTGQHRCKVIAATAVRQQRRKAGARRQQPKRDIEHSEKTQQPTSPSAAPVPKAAGTLGLSTAPRAKQAQNRAKPGIAPQQPSNIPVTDAVQGTAKSGLPTAGKHWQAPQTFAQLKDQASKASSVTNLQDPGLAACQVLFNVANGIRRLPPPPAVSLSQPASTAVLQSHPHVIAWIQTAEAAIQAQALPLQGLSQAVWACAVLQRRPSAATLDAVAAWIPQQAEAQPEHGTPVQQAFVEPHASNGAAHAEHTDASQHNLQRLPVSAAWLARLSWALACLSRLTDAASVHQTLLGNPPFEIVLGFMPEIDMADVLAEVDLRRDMIVMSDGRMVEEARDTAWQSDAGATFCYSGKEMHGGHLTPCLAAIRDRLAGRFGVHYDSVLINHYPDGKAGMRYHSDPLYGVWDSDTAVVSLGATREFVFREALPSLGPPGGKAKKPRREPAHLPYLVSHGDVVRMWGDCQERFQHCIKVEKEAWHCAPRLSLVFKKRLAAI